jgi:hypothetical protein
MKTVFFLLLGLLVTSSVHASAVLESVNTEHFTTTTLPVTAYPFTFSAWVKANDVTGTHTLVWLGDKDVLNHYWIMSAAGAAANDPVQVGARAGGAVATASSTIGYSANTWTHVCGIFTNATSRTVYLDGANNATETSSLTPTGIDQLAVGRLTSNSPTQNLDGKIAHVAVWDIALTGGNCASLAAGDNPLTISASDLIDYWPLDGNSSTNLARSNALTAQGPISFDTGDNPTVDAPPSTRRRRSATVFP